jgi:uracil-DNA glycosylase family protein
MAAPAVTALIPERPTVARLRAAAADCRACPLWKPATQTVFGEGPRAAALMLVGEQPGDREDREGRVFVGPAGRLLDDALDAAGIDRGSVYLTNAVKHFRHQAKGKRRIHQRPAAEHVNACRPWLSAELAVVKPTVIVCMGSIAAGALLGSKVRVTRDRGEPMDFPDLAPHVFVTVHPSAVVRSHATGDFHAQFDAFAADLRTAADAAG